MKIESNIDIPNDGKELGESQLNYIKKATKIKSFQKFTHTIRQLLNIPKTLINTYYCRHPLKIYNFIYKLAKNKNINGTYHPIINVPTLAGQFFFITSTPMIREIMKYPRLAQSELISEGRQLRVIAEALGRMRLNSERIEIKEKRNVLAHLMTRPERYLPKMFVITEKLIQKWRDLSSTPVKITQDISEFTVEIFLNSIMDYNGPYSPIVAILEEQIDLLGKRLAYRSIDNFENRFRELRDQLVNYVVPNHQKEQGASEYENRLNGYIEKRHKNEEAEAFATGLNGGTLAGYLAPNPAFLAAIYELAKNPEWQNKLLEEGQKTLAYGDSLEEYINSENSFLNAVIHEVLRLNPSQPFLFRNVENDIIIGEQYRLPKDSQIVADLYHALRDSSQWGKDAEIFNPLRFIENPILYRQPFLVYSTGPNNCLGQYFSRQTLKVLVYYLCSNFHWTTLTPAVNHKFHFALTLDQDVIIKLSPINKNPMEKNYV